ncbi:hypothetical protein CLF_113080, partial [Clonorchis sinensis]
VFVPVHRGKPFAETSVLPTPTRFPDQLEGSDVDCTSNGDLPVVGCMEARCVSNTIGRVHSTVTYFGRQPLLIRSWALSRSKSYVLVYSVCHLMIFDDQIPSQDARYHEQHNIRIGGVPGTYAGFTQTAFRNGSGTFPIPCLPLHPYYSFRTTGRIRTNLPGPSSATRLLAPIMILVASPSTNGDCQITTYREENESVEELEFWQTTGLRKQPTIICPSTLLSTSWDVALCLSGERQMPNDKYKTGPGNLGEILDPVYQSVNPVDQGQQQFFGISSISPPIIVGSSWVNCKKNTPTQRDVITPRLVAYVALCAEDAEIPSVFDHRCLQSIVRVWWEHRISKDESTQFLKLIMMESNTDQHVQTLYEKTTATGTEANSIVELHVFKRRTGMRTNAARNIRTVPNIIKCKTAAPLTGKRNRTTKIQLIDWMKTEPFIVLLFPIRGFRCADELPMPNKAKSRWPARIKTGVSPSEKFVCVLEGPEASVSGDEPECTDD